MCIRMWMLGCLFTLFHNLEPRTSPTDCGRATMEEREGSLPSSHPCRASKTNPEQKTRLSHNFIHIKPEQFKLRSAVPKNTQTMVQEQRWDSKAPLAADELKSSKSHSTNYHRQQTANKQEWALQTKERAGVNSGSPRALELN